MEKRKTIASFTAITVLLLANGFILALNVADVKATEWTGLDHPMGVAIGDYDNDGLNDIAIAEDAIGSRVTVYKSDGTTVIKQWTGIDYPQYVSIGDYDNDGLNDLAFSERDGPGNGKVTVYKSDGTTIIRQWTGIYTCPEGVAIGDYDNDGLNDIAFTDAPVSYEGRVRVFKSDGTLIAQWTNHYGPWGVAIGDYDNDGLNDIAFEESYNGKVFVYKSDGTTVIKQWTGLGGPAGVAIGDYDNDGLNDIAITEVSVAGVIGRVTVYKSDGTTVIKQWTGIQNPYGVAIGDYNNDGLNDLAFSEYDAGRVTVYYQTEQPPAPRAHFTYSPLDPYIGETITFDASASYDTDGTIVTYLWDFGDGTITTETAPIISHAYSYAGTYVVILTVTDNYGLTDASIGSITIAPVSAYTRSYLPHEWVEDGVAMSWHADDNSWPYALPFDFPFYGTYYRTIYISSNGLITFRGPDSSYWNSIAELANRLAIAVAWDDLATYYPRDIFIWQLDSTHVVVRWHASPLYNTALTVDFEAILGADGVIQLNYGYNDGSISATVGISNGIGDTIAEDIISSNYINTILFTPYQLEHDLCVHLEAPSYLPLGQSTILNATVENLGSNDEFDVELELRVNDEVVSSVVIQELTSGSSYMLSQEWTPTAEGPYNVSAYAPPVPEETITANNVEARVINVLAPETGFYDDFSDATLDPHWQIWKYDVRAPSPPEATYQQETRYSLTDNSGHLRYYLGSMTCEWVNEPLYAGPSSPYWYYPSAHLYRIFEGTDWILETKVDYSAPSANAAQQAFYVFFGDFQQGQGYRDNAIIVGASVWDAWHQVYIVENGVQRALTNLPINRYWDTFYYRIIRSGYQFVIQWSRDGVAYTTALTETMGSQIDGAPQGVGITGQAFWSDADEYSQYDYIYLTPPPEHELVASLEVPSVILLGQSTLLNATVYNGGLNSETNVELRLLIDGSLVSSVMIPELLPGSSQTLSYSWIATTEGTYSVTAYAIPVPGEADTANNEQTAVASVVRPLIQPVEGQWANYTITTTYGQVLWNIAYNEYYTPSQMHVTLWYRDWYGNTWTDWLILNILNRQVEAGMWSGYWYPLWIQTDVAMGSVVGILDRMGTVTESRYIEVGDYLVECWGLQVQYYDTLQTFWFDKVNGLVVGIHSMTPYNYTETWRLTSTNVPLVYLPRLRIQLSPEFGPIGTEVAITGVNAMPNSSVEIYWDNTYMGTTIADENGNFAYTLAAPPCTRGVHTIEAIALATGISDTYAFTVLPTISVTPVSGPMGTKVQVTGLGFLANESVVLTFEDMQIAEIIADSSGSFAAAFNIPLAQSGQYRVKAWYGPNYAQAMFTVTEVSELDVAIDVGAVYFKGETAEFYVQTAFNGKPIDVTTLNVQLYMPNGTARTLTYSRIAKGLYKILFAISGRGSMIGTYTVVAEATQSSSNLDAYGTSIGTFIVKPTWERETTKIAALSIASIGLIGAMLVLWKKEKKRYL